MFGELASWYEPSHPVVHRGDYYPVAARQGAYPLVRGEGFVEIDPLLAESGRPHLARLRRLRPRMHDGAVLVLDRLTATRLEVAASTYFDMVATGDALRDEYLAETVERRELPMRARAHAVARGGDPLVSGRGRAAAVGVSVIVRLHGRGGPALVLGRRRDDLPTDPGLWHVVPSGMLEPSPGGDLLLVTVQRELAEELGVTFSTAKLRRRLRWLGVAHDLLRLRPEACVYLDCTFGDLPGGQLQPCNDEFQEWDLVECSPEGIAAFWASRPPELLTPAAAGAMALMEERMVTEFQARRSGSGSEPPR